MIFRRAGTPYPIPVCTIFSAVSKSPTTRWSDCSYKEAASIKARDLSGATISGEDESEDWWVKEEADVFVNFLKSLASGDDGSLIDIGGGTATNIEYQSSCRRLHWTSF